MHYSACVKLDGLASWKENALNRCQAVPPFYVSVEGWRSDHCARATVYSIEIGMKLEGKAMIFTGEKRYSDLRGVHKALARTFQGLPDFPPKKFFGSRDVDFVRERQRKLHEYFERLPSAVHCENVQAFSDCFLFNKMKERWTREVQEELAATA